MLELKYVIHCSETEVCFLNLNLQTRLPLGSLHFWLFIASVKNICLRMPLYFGFFKIMNVRVVGEWTKWLFQSCVTEHACEVQKSNFSTF